LAGVFTHYPAGDPRIDMVFIGGFAPTKTISIVYPSRLARLGRDRRPNFAHQLHGLFVHAYDKRITPLYLLDFRLTLATLPPWRKVMFYQ
jgi:hypothetical protein